MDGGFSLLDFTLYVTFLTCLECSEGKKIKKGRVSALLNAFLVIL